MQSNQHKNPLQKVFKTEASSKEQRSFINQNRLDNSYNLKDFLPTSSMLEPRCKIKSNYITQNLHNIVYQQNDVDTKQNKSIFLNLGDRVIEQKMNKLKDENIALKQKLQVEQQLTKAQQQQINELKNKIKKLEMKEQEKQNRIKMWSYKYHYDFVPQQSNLSRLKVLGHKYQLAVQTDENQTKNKHNDKLKARDFQEIYKKLNIASTQTLNKKFNNNSKSNATNNNNNNINNFNMNKIDFISNSFKKPVSNLKIFPKKQQNKSKQFQLFMLPNFQDFIYDNNDFDKENNMQIANQQQNEEEFDEYYQKQADFYQQKNLKNYNQKLEIYPIEHQYLDSIVEQLMDDVSTRY